MGAKMLNKAKVRARLARVPKVVKGAASRQFDVEVAEMVTAIKLATPDDPGTPANALRDSTAAYRNPDRPLSWRIIVALRDRFGTFVAPKVEHGHRNADGTHTAARPWLFPTYRARRKGARRRVSGAVRKVLRQLYPR